MIIILEDYLKLAIVVVNSIGAHVGWLCQDIIGQIPMVKRARH